MAKNTAAWLTIPKIRPLQIKAAAYTRPKGDEIVIKNRAIALNPVDVQIQAIGSNLAFPWVKYPFIMGIDTAGEVVEIGSKVSTIKVGDRVLGQALGGDKHRSGSPEGAFQEYVVLLEHMASRIPDDLSFERACVLPLGLGTAACGLFQKDQLGLELPSSQPKPTGKTLLIWGGSTSVGSNAIQLAVAAGYEVFTTASPKNFAYVRGLGATKVFDYNSKAVVQDIIRAFQGRTTAGAMWIGVGSGTICMDILSKCEGDKVVTMAAYPMPPTHPTTLIVPTIIYYFMWGQVALWLKSKRYGIKYGFIFGSTLAFNEVGKAMYQDFLPAALEENRYIVAPDPIIVGKGLESIQAGLDLLRKRVSAKKVVVTLD
ncbi:uncharacterized protein A1O9_11795 [Exophiala aquamarina CBS 119918]|uniref:Enoyl reductase (ER) domain-containing protein n=1 Tax=Exophiala aquamarina CBS 119918 TaxID=1182545 RepID=A0A072NYS1_9EURO|nr:uncharacterized protein A1O9_11795 [Exophiala aquamarina CBS 119918]KEF52168.1 hypothetical protein A1O9_11795 [Exophiala aquamarina CBS 119918]